MPAVASHGDGSCDRVLAGRRAAVPVGGRARWLAQMCGSGCPG
jgi:hypothetical protein